jgi:thioredoxin 1
VPRHRHAQIKEIEMADNGKTVVVTDSNFGDEIEKHSGLSMLDFWAAWCGPCRMVGPVVEQLAGEYEGKVKVGKLDVDANQATAMRFNIRSIPSILFFKDGKHVDTVVGAVPKAFLERKIQELSTAA